MNDGSSLPTEHLKFSLSACMLFFSVKIPVPRLKFKNEADFWDFHHARLKLKSTRKTIEVGRSSAKVTAAEQKQLLCIIFATKNFLKL